MSQGSLFRVSALRRRQEAPKERHEPVWLTPAWELAAFWITAALLVILLLVLALLPVPYHVSVPAVVRAGRVEADLPPGARAATLHVGDRRIPCVLDEGRPRCDGLPENGTRGTLLVEAGRRSTLAQLVETS
ncbi:hypothetical protein ACIBH1_25220 [Nonomuraea sp. NPDC050663]|uniref:hypothetical protein n=1 Tax=Nonomuraea sp. NPDC050663 TaxID=3364370 RepID=UPI0037873893